MQTDSNWLPADWSAPPGIFAGTTTRFGGVSIDPDLASNNMGLQVGDEAALVAGNRERLRELVVKQQSQSSIQLQWIDQVHGSDCVYIDSASAIPPRADALWTDRECIALAIQTADCVPVMLADDQGEIIAAAHGGWRGLLDQVLTQLVQALPTSPANLRAWIGPCIGPAYFEVGAEVWRRVIAVYPEAVTYHPNDETKRFVDLPLLAKRQLQASGVRMINGGEHCTYAGHQFYSYRQAIHDRGARAQTGRMATVICL